MLLSQLRWILALAIGVCVMIAVWLDPEVKAPGGVEATIREPIAAKPLFEPPPPPGASWEERVAAYRNARTTLLTSTPPGGVQMAALESLRQQYFPAEELDRAKLTDEQDGVIPSRSKNPEPPKL